VSYTLDVAEFEAALAQAYIGALVQLAALHEERCQYAVAHALLRLLKGAWRKDG
jgi:hypothetical protein